MQHSNSTYPSAERAFPAYALSDWHALLDKPVQALHTTLPGGVVLEPLYTSGPTYTVDTTHTPPGWQICQTYALGDDPAAVKRDVDQDVQNGVTVLRFARAISHGALVDVLADVNLARVWIQLEAGPHTTNVPALLFDLWQKRGIPLSHARGAFQLNPLTLGCTTGDVAILEQSYDVMASLLQTCARMHAGADVHCIGIDGQSYDQAGADVPLTLGCMVATALDYLRAMQTRGCDPGMVWQRMRFLLCMDGDVFLSMASVRALRMVCQRIGVVLSDALQVDLRGHHMPIDAETAQRVITADDPWNNLLRGCVTAFAAGIGGVDSMHVRHLDEAVAVEGMPRIGRRMARNTQLILQHESHLNQVQDAAAGSWYVEQLTAQVAHAAWNVLQQIERKGGMQQAVTTGWVSNAIAQRKNTP